jgi:hypothetical protein
VFHRSFHLLRLLVAAGVVAITAVKEMELQEVLAVVLLGVTVELQGRQMQ